MAFASMPLSYKRLYSGALDEDSVFESLSAAQEYTAGPTSYAGQIIGVKVDDNNYSPYIINADKTVLFRCDVIKSNVCHKTSEKRGNESKNDERKCIVNLFLL